MEFLTHIRWFNRREVLPEVPLHPSVPTLFFFTDASRTGWGASWQTCHLSGSGHIQSPPNISTGWNSEVMRLAVLHWGPHQRNQTVAYIRKQGGTYSISLFNKMLELFQLLPRHHSDPHHFPTPVTAVASSATSAHLRPHVPLTDVALFQYILNIRRPQFHRNPCLLDLAAVLLSRISSNNTTSPTQYLSIYLVVYSLHRNVLPTLQSVPLMTNGPLYPITQEFSCHGQHTMPRNPWSFPTTSSA